MKKIFLFLFVVQLWSVIHTSDIHDVNIVYKLSDESDQGDIFSVDPEIHVMANSRGKLFLLENETIISPTSSRSLPPFCFPTSPSCRWRSNESWISSSISKHQLRMLSLPLHGFDLPCKYHNGGCQIECQTRHDKSLCYCPSDFYLDQDHKTCISSERNVDILTEDSGELDFWNVNLYDYYSYTWIIKTSKDKIINLIVSSLNIEEELVSAYRSTVYVYDGLFARIRTWSGDTSNMTAKSTGNIMKIYFETTDAESLRGFYAKYYTETAETSGILNLQNETGVITSSVNISQPNLCVTLIYLLSFSGSLNVYAEQSLTGKTYFREIHTNKINGWHISRYVSTSSLVINDNSSTLSVHITGRNSQILQVAECSSNGEDVYVLPRLFWRRQDRNPTITSQYPYSLSLVVGHVYCSHGGTYDNNTNKCLCPIGFAGSNCTKACGPNHFGDDCSGLCSSFQDGCRKKMFCNNKQYCTCAAGYTGNNCEKECEPGTYGTNCGYLCGKCKEGSCDIYTGECDGLCEEGYQLPLCQYRYAFLWRAPIVKEISWNHIVISINFSNTNGVGTPHLYEVQYKELDSHKWDKTTIQEIGSRSIVLANVRGLRHGTQYSLKVSIICEDGNRYEGIDIPTVEFETLCQVPNSSIYEIDSKNVTTSSFLLTWNYPVHSDKWCPVSSFEIILQYKWNFFSPKVCENNYTSFSALLPAHLYTVYVCAVTKHGKAPCSQAFSVTTKGKAPGKVRHLIVESRNATNIQISWRRPLFTGETTMRYRIHYECVTYLICEESCRHSNGSVETTEHSANLTNLLPHVQYKIRVAAYSSSQGPNTILFVTTKSKSPDVSPLASDQQIVSEMNTSVTVQWQPPPCPGRNGQLIGYYFTLTTETEGGKTVLQNGTTPDTQTSFTSLTPTTEYLVNVYAMNSHGFNINNKLTIPISTSATVPDAVQNLQVYKKGRRMFGIRWAEPSRVYGTLKSFTVTYHQKGSENKFSQNVSPSACIGWPNLYCHTVNTNLQPDKEYIVSVSARNNDIEENGLASEISIITRENAPEAPSSLKITKSTNTSFEINWGLPLMFNGELRSFLVNVEHIESLNESECCEYFPVQELPFREESPVYNLEVTGLIPASTYIISVSAKTITMGPSINATYNTSPLPPIDLKSPQVVGVADDGYSYLFKIEPSRMVLSSDSIYLLLVLPCDEIPPPVIWERELLEKLSQKVNASFYIVSEFARDEFESAQEVKIGTGGEIKNGTVGQLVDPKFAGGYYQVGLALVQRYGQAISVGLASSNRLEFGKIAISPL